MLIAPTVQKQDAPQQIAPRACRQYQEGAVPPGAGGAGGGGGGMGGWEGGVLGSTI